MHTAMINQISVDAAERFLLSVVAAKLLVYPNQYLSHRQRGVTTFPRSASLPLS